MSMPLRITDINRAINYDSAPVHTGRWLHRTRHRSVPRDDGYEHPWKLDASAFRLMVKRLS